MKEKRIIVLGATGSIGTNCFDAVRNLGIGYRVVGASCHAKRDELLRLAEEFSIHDLAVSGTGTEHPGIRWSGADAVRRLLHETEADIVVNGISGSPGLMPSVWSLRTGKDLALANKETIVMAGPLIQDLAARTGRSILPVDSEHSDLFHLLQNRRKDELRRIIITASGGAFRDTPLDDFPRINLEQALQHPTWNMGGKITIDSATMANKGLEIIEAHFLFHLPASRITVLIHPQSCIHSLVQTIEGSCYAQISSPDMRIPIQNALTFPSLHESPFGELDFSATTMTFQEPDPERYPLLPLAYQAAEDDGSYPLVYNAANEAAVEAFRTGKIRFIDIAPVVEKSLQPDWSRPPDSFDDAMQTHHLAWQEARRHIKTLLEHNR